MDLDFAASSLSRFSAAPCIGHLEIAFHLFVELTKFSNKRFQIFSNPLNINRTTNLWEGDYMLNCLKGYPDAKKDQDLKESKTFRKPFQTSVFFDASHAHDRYTRRCTTGIFIYSGSTLVQLTAKR